MLAVICPTQGSPVVEEDRSLEFHDDRQIISSTVHGSPQLKKNTKNIHVYCTRTKINIHM